MHMYQQQHVGTSKAMETHAHMRSSDFFRKQQRLHAAEGGEEGSGAAGRCLWPPGARTWCWTLSWGGLMGTFTHTSTSGPRNKNKVSRGTSGCSCVCSQHLVLHMQVHSAYHKHLRKLLEFKLCMRPPKCTYLYSAHLLCTEFGCVVSGTNRSSYCMWLSLIRSFFFLGLTSSYCQSTVTSPLLFWD